MKNIEDNERRNGFDAPKEKRNRQRDIERHDVGGGPWLWQYGLWSFQAGSTKLERFLPKNQHSQGKLLNFENWVNGEVLKSAKI